MPQRSSARLGQDQHATMGGMSRDPGPEEAGPHPSRVPDMDAVVTNVQIGPDVLVRLWSQGSADGRYPAAAHAALELTWVLSGVVGYRVGRRRWEPRSGEAMLVPAGVEHITRFSDNARSASVHIGPELTRMLAPERDDGAPSDPELLVPEASPRLARLGELIVEEACQAAPGYRIAVAGLTEALAIELLRCGRGRERSSRRRDPRISRVVELIQTCYADPLSLETLAIQANMSRYHFAHVFSQVTGTSPYRYLTEVRVRRAAALLRETRRSVTEIALTVGFQDSARFGKAFREVIGCSPSEHRRAPRLNARR